MKRGKTRLTFSLQQVFIGDAKNKYTIVESHRPYGTGDLHNTSIAYDDRSVEDVVLEEEASQSTFEITRNYGSSLKDTITKQSIFLR